jgi:hypothetical protein
MSDQDRERHRLEASLRRFLASQEPDRDPLPDPPDPEPVNKRKRLAAAA